MLTVIIFLSIFSVVAVVYGIITSVLYAQKCDYYDIAMDACEIAHPVIGSGREDVRTVKREDNGSAQI